MRRRAFVISGLAAGGLAAAARGLAQGSPPRTRRATIPGLASDNAAGPLRTYGMGWFVFAPVPTVESLIATTEVSSRISDYAMLQREPPWDRLLAGESMESVAKADYDELIAFLRGKGLRMAMLVDPLNGLDRTREGPLLVAAGRSIMDDRILAMHEEWVRLIASRYKPDYLGLASEINTPAELGPVPLYERIRGMCNRMAPEVRRLSPGTKVFVSFQVDQAWGKFQLNPVRQVDHFALAREFDVDVFGLSSYPSFVFKDPAEIPDDYYQRFADATGKPLVQVEGGWASAGIAPDGRFSEEKQKRYFDKLFQLVEGVDAELLILLMFADADFSDPRWTASPADLATLQNFATMGIADSRLTPKPSYATWEGRFKLRKA